MNVSLIIILLVGAFATYMAGDKVASKVALFFNLALGCSIVLLKPFLMKTLAFIQWINQPNVSFACRWIINSHAIINNSIDSNIIYTSFGLNIKCESFYSLIYLCLCNGLNILAQMDFILHLGIIFNPIYFIALIWGNGDAEERKSSSKILYSHSSSLFMLIAFIYLYQQGKFLD
jgi:NADH-quinone oxidoreductase subunit M